MLIIYIYIIYIYIYIHIYIYERGEDLRVHLLKKQGNKSI